MNRSLCAFVFLAALAGCSRESPPQTASRQSSPKATRHPRNGSTEVGDPMPPYQGKLLDGTDFRLESMRGSVVLINVWATWCGPCRFEIPELEALQKRSGSGLKVVGISVDEGGEESVKQFVAAQKMTYTIALDPDGRIANLLQTTVLPTSVLIDRTGKIVWRQVGALPPNDARLQAALDAALGNGRKG